MKNKVMKFLHNGGISYLISFIIALFTYSLLYISLFFIPKGVYLEEVAINLGAIFVTLMIFLITIKVIKSSLKLNIVLPIELDKVIEFSKALEDLCKDEFTWQIEYIRHKKVNIYFYNKALLKDENNIKVKRLISYDDVDGLKNLNGTKQLCLDYEDYDRLLKEKYEFEDFKISEEVTRLKAKLNDCEELSSKLQEENTKMSEELEEVKKKNQTFLAREAKEKNQKQAKLPFYFLAYSTLKALEDRATAETKYTRPEIQKAFEEELDKNKDLKQGISALLQDFRLKKSINPYDLTGWAMEYLRDSLGDKVKKIRNN